MEGILLKTVLAATTATLVSFVIRNYVLASKSSVVNLPGPEIVIGEKDEKHSVLFELTQNFLIALIMYSASHTTAIESYKIAIMIWATFYAMPAYNSLFFMKRKNIAFSTREINIHIVNGLITILSISAYLAYFS